MFFSLVPSDRIDLSDTQTTRRHDRAFFLTYENLPRSVYNQQPYVFVYFCIFELLFFCISLCIHVKFV